MEKREIEIAEQKQAVEATPVKKETRGRTKAVKKGQGKKKKQKKKASTKTLKRKKKMKPKESEDYHKRKTEHYGASKVDKILIKAKNKTELDEMIRRLKYEMELELEDEKKEVEEYYAKIDAEYKKVGRPKSVFNERELRYLCSIHCTLEEIAGFFQMNKDTLSQKIREEYGIGWAEFYERNSQGSKVSLRRRQIQAAMEGDTQMLKFLGKNMLGQKEKVDFEGAVKVNSWVDLVNDLGGQANDGGEGEDDGES